MNTVDTLRARLAFPETRKAALAEVQAARRETHALTAAALGIHLTTFDRLCREDAGFRELVVTEYAKGRS